MIIRRAPWLLPVSSPPVADGGIAVQVGIIAAVGPFREVQRNWPGAQVIEHPDCVLLPGLINAHTHLELSHLAYLGQQPAPSSFPAWIERLLAARSQAAADDAAMLQAARQALAQQQAEGVAVLADISNSGLTSQLAAEFSGSLLVFKEYLGLREDSAAVALLRLQQENETQLCTGHAPYSTHSLLLRGLKARANRLGHVFPIHTAESAAEIELLRSGGGPFRDFLEKRGLWDGAFQAMGKKGGAVHYLHQHGLLDSRTLCVHCVHIDAEEIALLAESGAKVCLCPGSNRSLGVGKAPVGSLLKKGILPAISTDSLASNPELSLWREMRLLADEHPSVPPETILAMATLGGAAALGLDKRLGSLEVGKEAVILAAAMEHLPPDALAAQEELLRHPAVQRQDNPKEFDRQWN
ncbi:MAG: amidohydrolase family protein [Candidatus Electronema sp. V4]|uniref:amidohydrolase family protein n=1 Tax=Candidatus Electronema sp. V4 TaxID=3454756 RepID=UPI0040557F63